MEWLAQTENPAAITSLFSSPPSLENIEIMSIKIDCDGPTVDLRLGLREYPKSPPVRWKQLHANAVVLDLQLMAIVSIKLDGWSTTNNATVSIQRAGARLEVRVTGPTLELRCNCGYVRISGISGYRQEPSSS